MQKLRRIPSKLCEHIHPLSTRSSHCIASGKYFYTSVDDSCNSFASNDSKQPNSGGLGSIVCHMHARTHTSMRVLRCLLTRDVTSCSDVTRDLNMLQNLPHGLRMAAQRGLVAMFATLCRKCPTSRLGKHDENGMTLMHHAAVNNRPHIITLLVLLAQDVNVRKISTVFAAGKRRSSCGFLHRSASTLWHAVGG